MSTPASEFLTPKEAAAALGISVSSIYRLMESQTLPWTKIGGSRRIPRAALVAMASSNFVGDKSLLDGTAGLVAERHSSTYGSRSVPTMEQTRRAIAERFNRVKQGTDFDLAYAYRRVLVDLETQGDKGGARDS